MADPDEALIEAIAEAIFVDQPCVKPWKYEQCWVDEHSGFDDPSPSPRCDYVLSRARAVVAVADEEHAALVAEVERLRGEVARMRLERDCSDAALVVLKGDADSLGDALTEEVLRAEAAEAKLAKVEALAEEEEAKCLRKPPLLNGSRFPAIVSVSALRAVLADAPAEQRAEGGA